MTDREPIEVCITVDTEFSIGGNFDNPEMAPVGKPIVLGAIGGQEHGLGFMLDSLAEFGIRATFFVETLQTAYFGDEPMGEIARRIADAGHDVQLHLHPCWLHYEDPAKRGWNGAPNDSCAGRSDVELDRFFSVGLSAFSRWGVPPPIAVRSGNLQADANFYRAAARWQIALSSSVVLRAGSPADKNLKTVGVRQRIGQVLEFPVFSFIYQFGRNKCIRPLAITACSHREIVSVLRHAYNHGISPILIYTHPQEFLKRTDITYTNLRRNRVNQARFKTILRFLSENKDRFVTAPISSIRQDGTGDTGLDNRPISVSSRKALARMIENAINDRVWWY